MKFMGTIFGEKLLLDTEDELIAKEAGKYLENLRIRDLKLQEIETDTEMSKLLNNKKLYE